MEGFGGFVWRCVTYCKSPLCCVTMVDVVKTSPLPPTGQIWCLAPAPDKAGQRAGRPSGSKILWVPLDPQTHKNRSLVVDVDLKTSIVVKISGSGPPPFPSPVKKNQKCPKCKKWINRVKFQDFRNRVQNCHSTGPRLHCDRPSTTMRPAFDRHSPAMRPALDRPSTTMRSDLWSRDLTSAARAS